MLCYIASWWVFIIVVIPMGWRWYYKLLRVTLLHYGGVYVLTVVVGDATAIP
jgi:hypothetical protein